MDADPAALEQRFKKALELLSNEQSADAFRRGLSTAMEMLMQQTEPARLLAGTYRQNIVSALQGAIDRAITKDIHIFVTTARSRTCIRRST